jgi:hypothetical protein
MDIRFLTSIDIKSTYCLLKGSESGSFACRLWLDLLSLFFQPVKQSK